MSVGSLSYARDLLRMVRENPLVAYPILDPYHLAHSEGRPSRNKTCSPPLLHHVAHSEGRQSASKTCAPPLLHHVAASNVAILRYYFSSLEPSREHTLLSFHFLLLGANITRAILCFRLQPARHRRSIGARLLYFTSLYSSDQHLHRGHEPHQRAAELQQPPLLDSSSLRTTCHQYLS